MSCIPREPGSAFPAGFLPKLAALRDARLCQLAKGIASAAFDISESEIALPSRSHAPICEARHIAMYLASTSFEVKLATIAREFGRDRTSVGHAVRRIEDRRDDKRFEAKLERLERLAEACLAIGAMGDIRR